jgi:pyruvate formate lyase activating enzyme
MQIDKMEAGSRAHRHTVCTALERQDFRIPDPAKNTQSGWVLNFQQFSIEDGPGLRTTMFLKGCPLSCPWCSNPESIFPLPQVKFAAAQCRGCGACVRTCPECCLSLDETHKVVFNAARCSHCMQCLNVCPAGCVSGIGLWVTKDNALNMLLKDRPFYENTGGGVTISGGEPLFQFQFTVSILKELKAQGIHTAIDTTGYAPLKALRMVLEHTDLVLFDIKHLDPVRHKEVIGVSNEIIMKNLRACKGLSEFWLRTPLIPGFNDDLAHMEAIVDLAHEVDAARCYFLLFHRWGEHKYARIGLPNTYANIQEFTPKAIAGFKQRFQDRQDYVFFERA